MYDTILVDGNNIFFKNFATQKLSVKIDGEVITTGATYGFINSLLTLRRKYDNARIIVAWDRGYVRRSKLYPEYKANRNKDEWEERENFYAQMAMCTEVLKHLGVRQAYKEGEEADDIVGTLSKTYRDRGERVLIMSADKDYQQLIDKDIDLLAHKGPGNIKVWNENTWEKANGFHPSKFVYILAIQGDAGDNIPGIKGIGEKGARELVINHFSLIDRIINGDIISDLIPIKQTAAMKKVISPEGQANIKISYELALIDRNIKKIKIMLGRKNMEHVEDLFEIYKFHSLLRDENWRQLEEI